MIVAIYAALLGLLVIALSARVVGYRRAHKIGIGLRDDKDLERRVRVHANAIENVPIALIVIAFFEQGGAPGWSIHALGGALFLARIGHAYGLNKTVRTSWGRMFGTLVTWIVIVVASLGVLAQFALR
jgi:uncharacterized protein